MQQGVESERVWLMQEGRGAASPAETVAYRGWPDFRAKIRRTASATCADERVGCELQVGMRIVLGHARIETQSTSS